MDIEEFYAAQDVDMPDTVLCPTCGFQRSPVRMRDISDRVEFAHVASVMAFAPFVCEACLDAEDRQLVAAALRNDAANDPAPVREAADPWSAVIAQRNAWLNDSLWMLDPDARGTDEQKVARTAYRRALHQIPLGFASPEKALAALEALHAPD